MKSSRGIRFLVCLAALWLASLSCNSPQAQNTQDLGAIVARTQTAQSLAAFLSQTVQPSATGVPVTPVPPSAAASLTPSSSPTPSPSPTLSITQPPNCTNSAKFEGETVPDDTPFAGGQEFTKTWTLRNTGTCSWTPDYFLLFDSGERMEGASPLPIGRLVQPNTTTELALPLVAPDQAGSYQGFWKLSSPAGQPFGLGQKADKPFWVQITVTSSGSSVRDELGDPMWVESFESNSSRFYLGSDSEVRFEIDDGSLVMTALTRSGDQWRVAQSVTVSDFYMEAQFRMGEQCLGDDSYGMIVRAPDQADNFIDSGYVFVFSCTGRFRIYRMDNNAYQGLVNWTASAHISPGPDETNIMGIWADGDQFQLFANGQMIASFSDSTYQQGYYGLTIRTVNTPGLEVLVDMVSYWQID